MSNWWARACVSATWPLIVLTYKAWGRWWLTDDQCRGIVTAIMGVTLRIAGRPVSDATEGGQG